MPERIQLRRTKGWRKPEGAVVVARPTRWGNPFIVGKTYGASGPHGEWHRSVKIRDRADAVAEYRRALGRGHAHYFPLDFRARVRRELAGKDLACWCPLDQPCHADVLLEIANQEDGA